MTDTLMFFILGLSIGAIVPTVYLAKTLLKDLLIQTKGYKDIEARLAKVEKEVREMAKEETFTREDLPYDAMGDYSETGIQPDGFVSDDWYHEEFGEEA